MEYQQIGYTQKSHGVQGELKVFIEEPYEEVFLASDRVFLEVRGAKLPYFIKSIRGQGALIVHFEEVENRESAVLLQSKAIFLPANEAPEVDETLDDTEFGYLTGFTLEDAHDGPIGSIREVLDLPAQETAVVEIKGADVLIPLHNSLIVSVHKKEKKIVMNLPEGLI